MITFKFDVNDMVAPKTYDTMPGVFTGTSWGVWLSTRSHECVSTSSIDQKCV